MSSSGFAPRRRQGGFIQGAILFALVIIAVVVAAFSLANRDSQSSADTEQARVNASFVLKVGNDLQTGINRAVADGFSPAKLETNMFFDATESTGDNLNLFNPDLKYMVRPQFPPTALVDPDVQPFTGTDGEGAGATADWVLKVITGAGSENLAEAIVLVDNMKEDVCRRINVTANGQLVTADVPATLGASVGSGATAVATSGWREGCYGSAGNYTYYRVVATDVADPPAA